MRNKKNAKPQSSPEDELVQRVDAMLSPFKPDTAPLAKPAAAKPAKDSPLDIFAGKKPPVKIDVTEPAAALAMAQTAPELPKKLMPKGKPALAEAPKPKVEQVAQPEPELEPTPDAGPNETTVNLEDADTDKAVDDITAGEADTLLAVEDAKAGKAAKPKAKKSANASTSHDSGWKARLAGLFRGRKGWLIIAAVILLVVFAVPLTRYKLLGLVIKEPVDVRVLDSKTATPVSNADVTLSGKNVKTNADGQAKLKVPIGSSTLQINKQYYAVYKSKIFVGFSGAKSGVRLVATGRQVPITVLNRITGKPLGGAEIKILATTAKTNAKGLATIVLPANSASDNAAITLSGYNQLAGSVQVTSQVVPANTFYLTPAGHIYFLSNLSGKIDVVKTNLDGTERKTVFGGTGHEDPNTTSLLASRDWRYLVLKAARSGGSAALYLVDTSNDHVSAFDTNNADFYLVGWTGHNFIYDLVSNSVPASSSGHEILKSYDAENTQLNQLDQDQTEGSPDTAYAYQTFLNFYIADGALVYNTQWYSVGGYDVSSKTATIRSVTPGVSSKKDYLSLPANNVSYAEATLYAPRAVYFGFYNGNTGQWAYYNYQNRAASPTTSVNQTSFSKSYPTYLLSPNGNRTFWAELRDGKNTLFVGDQDGSSPTQIASLSDYAPYGWYSDNYVLVAKSSSELYVMPAAGGQPLKITDYYKPAQTYPGYGYGYGGV